MNKLFAYPGGEWPIRNLVVSCLPEHETFVDVFGGSAAILITKDPSKGEVFNDKNEEIVNFFRVVKHRPAMHTLARRRSREKVLS
jgi:DNA adenine methylase